ncbi:MAG: hypothetical protein NC116_06015 [Clostridium sp.]|nr:hypothetical protein [Clostridium sp.]
MFIRISRLSLVVEATGSLKAVFQGGDEEALAETAGTAEKIDLAGRHKGVYKGGLGDIGIAVVDDTLKIPDAYRVLHGC